jgi:hypothetical protein
MVRRSDLRAILYAQAMFGIWLPLTWLQNRFDPAIASWLLQYGPPDGTKDRGSFESEWVGLLVMLYLFTLLAAGYVAGRALRSAPQRYARIQAGFVASILAASLFFEPIRHLTLLDAQSLQWLIAFFGLVFFACGLGRGAKLLARSHDRAQAAAKVGGSVGS